MSINIFENRDKRLSTLIKLGDCLGRSLRENVCLFSVDNEKSKVMYLTEGRKFISGYCDFNKLDSFSINGIEVTDVDNFINEKQFDEFVNKKVRTFISNIFSDDYRKANESFTGILKLWEDRLGIENTLKKLSERSEKFNQTLNIVNTPEFLKFKEIKASIVKFLGENRNKIKDIPEIKSAIILSNTISEAFNFPKLSYEDLVEQKTYPIRDLYNNSIYEVICKQELVKKELLESKRAFRDSWATNEKIRNLSNNIYDKAETIQKSLAEAIIDVPYLALASKKQLTEIFDNILNLRENIVPPKQIQEYSSYVFELKKGVRNLVITTLNEKYGINVQNLKDTANFKNLVNTQIVIFETLARLSPKSSVQKEVLSTLADSLKNKSGIESIDVNDIINEIFSEAKLDLIQEASMHNYLDFGRIADDLGGIVEILKMIQQMGMSKTNPMMPGQENQLTPQGAGQHTGHPTPNMDPTQLMTGGEQGEEMPPKLAQDPNQAGAGLDTPEDSEENTIPPEGMPGHPMGNVGQENPAVHVAGNQLMAGLAELEDLISDIKLQLGEEPEEYVEDEENPEGMVPGQEELGQEEPGEEEHGGGDEEGQNVNVDAGEEDNEIPINKSKGSTKEKPEKKDKKDPKEKGGFPPKKKKGFKGKEE